MQALDLCPMITKFCYPKARMRVLTYEFTIRALYTSLRMFSWCTKCRHFKPPRAHHDSVSGRCVVKLDHWCPWTNNTVSISGVSSARVHRRMICLDTASTCTSKFVVWVSESLPCSVRCLKFLALCVWRSPFLVISPSGYRWAC